MEIFHTAIWVSDVEATLDFYVETLGLECPHRHVDEEGIDNLYLSGDGDVEIQFKFDPNDPLTRVSPEPIDHIAFTVRELEKIVEDVQKHTEYRVVREPWARQTRRGYRARLALLKDPNGYTVELIDRHPE